MMYSTEEAGRSGREGEGKMEEEGKKEGVYRGK